MTDQKFKIMLSGGGTGGSVTPVLAVAQEFYRQYPKTDFVFVGTASGPEKHLVEELSGRLPIRFVSMLSGKWRRYFSLRNLVDLFNIGAAFFQSFYILKRERPQAVISAGSFVSVPLIWAAKFSGVPVLIHQQDMRPGLANRLMAPAARIITVTFSNSLAVYGSKAILTGNPYFLPSLASRAQVLARYDFDPERPLILIFGGGTGALALNKAVAADLDDLLSLTQVIHVFGRGKLAGTEIRSGYRPLDFLDHEDLLAAMAASDLIVSRPGLGTLTELSALQKASILVPIPNTHQEDNAQACVAAGAALAVEQKDLAAKLVRLVGDLLSDKARRQVLQEKMSHLIKSGASETIVRLVVSLIVSSGKQAKKK